MYTYIIYIKCVCGTIVAGNVVNGFCPWLFYGFRYVIFMVSVTFLMGSVAGLLVDSAAAGGSTILERIERFLVLFCILRTGFRRCFLFMVSVVAGKRCCMVSVVVF